MKKRGPTGIQRNVAVSFVALLFLSIFTTEYQGKLTLRRHAKTGALFANLKKVYGEPRYAYRNWESLPQPYQELFVEPKRPEDIYYSYQREGLPSYWSFVVSVNSETQTIQRYIYWKAGALKPREEIQ